MGYAIIASLASKLVNLNKLHGYIWLTGISQYILGRNNRGMIATWDWLLAGRNRFQFVNALGDFVALHESSAEVISAVKVSRTFGCFS